MKLTIVFLAMSFLEAYAQGVFVYKNKNFHDDAGAHAFVYSSVSIREPITWVKRGNEEFSFEKNQFHDWIPLKASIPDNISTEIEILNFRKEVVQVRAFYDRYPRAQPLMKQVMDSMAQALLKLDNNQRRYQKTWISLDRYNAQLKEIEQKLERLELEKKVRELAIVTEQKRVELAIVAEQKRVESEKKIKDEKLKAEVDQQAEAIRQRREMKKEERIFVAEQKIVSVRSDIQAIEVNQSVFIEKLNNLLNSQ